MQIIVFLLFLLSLLVTHLFFNVCEHIISYTLKTIGGHKTLLLKTSIQPTNTKWNHHSICKQPKNKPNTRKLTFLYTCFKFHLVIVLTHKGFNSCKKIKKENVLPLMNNDSEKKITFLITPLHTSTFVPSL
jgi:hypothetical protein